VLVASGACADQILELPASASAGGLLSIPAGALSGGTTYSVVASTAIAALDGASATDP
jgi:hypothetical protein